MKVLLVNPPYNIKRYMGGLSKMGWVFPPIGLLYLAAYIRRENKQIEVKIYDSQVEEKPLLESLKEFSPDFVGITCQTALVYSTLETAKIVKEQFPKCKVIVGGAHATLRSQDIIKSEHVDICVMGEGEDTLLEILDGKKPADILGICYKEGEKVIYNTRRPLEKNIDKFPTMAMDLIPLHKYKISPDMKMGDRLGLILTTRGCPYGCLFCSNSILTNKSYRIRSVENVIHEIDYLLEHNKINQLMIIDDNFCINKQRTLELCRKFVEKGYPQKFSFWAEARVDNLDEETIRALKEAGCSIMSFGLESGVQRVLDYIHKRITLEQTRKTVGLIHKYKINARGSFILGLPTTSREEDEQTIKFAYSLPLDQVRFSIATPLPGTELWDIAVKEGKVDPENIDWTRLSLMGGYTDYDPIYYPEGRTAKEMKRLQKRANLGFFLRPRIIWGYAKRITSPKQAYHIISGGLRLIKSSF